MPDILDHARAEVASAENKLNSVYELAEAFLNEKPYFFVIHVNPKLGEYIFRARMRATPPDTLVRAIREVVHDLRVGLDYTAFALGEKFLKSEPPAGTEFPIFWDKGKFEKTNAK